MLKSIFERDICIESRQLLMAFWKRWKMWDQRMSTMEKPSLALDSASAFVVWPYLIRQWRETASLLNLRCVQEIAQDSQLCRWWGTVVLWSAAKLFSLILFSFSRVFVVRWLNMTNDCKNDEQVKKTLKDKHLDTLLTLLLGKTHSYTFTCNYIGFHGGILFSRKCLFNNQLKVSQAASLQEECALWGPVGERKGEKDSLCGGGRYSERGGIKKAGEPNKSGIWHFRRCAQQGVRGGRSLCTYAYVCVGVYACVRVFVSVWSCQTGHLSFPRCSFSVSFHPARSSTAPTWSS